MTFRFFSFKSLVSIIAKSQSRAAILLMQTSALLCSPPCRDVSRLPVFLWVPAFSFPPQHPSIPIHLSLSSPFSLSPTPSLHPPDPPQSNEMQPWPDAQTRCDYQAQTAVSLSSPSVCLSCSLLPPLVSVSLRLLHPPSCFHSDYSAISSSFPLFCASLLPLPNCCCSLSLLLSLPLVTLSPCLTLHPSYQPSLPAVWRSSKLLSSHTYIAQHTSLLCGGKHVSYSGHGPDCMLWEWSGE